MTQFPNKFKKPYFWPIFPIFGAKNIFLENLALSCTTSYGFLATCQNLEKVNDTIQRKRLERWKDGQTLFYRTLLATAGGLKSHFYELWQQHKQLKTMEMSEAWPDIYNEGYIQEFQPETTHKIN